MKIAVCVHLYHIDMIDDITGYLKNLEHEYDLFISLTKNYPNSFINNLKNINKKTEIVYVKNIGMDIGGFLQVYKLIDNSYDLILKIHTKKGIGGINKPSRFLERHGVNTATIRGKEWFDRLMKSVLGNKETVNKIINEFSTNQKCGMVGGKRNNNFEMNAEEMRQIFKIMKLNVNFENHFFVGGTIFWVRNSVLKKYLTNEIIDKILEKSPEGYAYEPSINHAMERVFGSLVYLDNKELYKF